MRFVARNSTQRLTKLIAVDGDWYDLVDVDHDGQRDFAANAANHARRVRTVSSFYKWKIKPPYSVMADVARTRCLSFESADADNARPNGRQVKWNRRFTQMNTDASCGSLCSSVVA